MASEIFQLVFDLRFQMVCLIARFILKFTKTLPEILNLLIQVIGCLPG